MVMRYFPIVLVTVVGLLFLLFLTEFDLVAAGGPTRDGRQRLELEELVAFGGFISLALAFLAWMGHRRVGRELDLRHQAERRAREAGSYDDLTGLGNRRLFEARVDALLARGGRCAVLFIDLDGFKPVNDTYGHATGDALLRAVAARLRASARHPDDAARLGGDEFALLVELRADDADGAGFLARRVLKSLREPVEIEGRRIEVGGTIGIAVGPDAGSDAAVLVHAADLAMYEGKRERRGSVTTHAA
jgi:diguanylate cyclase (GGDEF)-like protein